MFIQWFAAKNFSLSRARSEYHRFSKISKKNVEFSAAPQLPTFQFGNHLLLEEFLPVTHVDPPAELPAYLA